MPTDYSIEPATVLFDPTSSANIELDVYGTYESSNYALGPKLPSFFSLVADPQVPAFLLSGTCPSFPVYRESARTQGSGSGEPLLKLMEDLFGDAHADIQTLPPRSVRRASVKARRGGRAQPLPLILEDD
jgi:hypothetical protein